MKYKTYGENVFNIDEQAFLTAWEQIIQPQLDPRINACGFTRVFNSWDKAQ